MSLRRTIEFPSFFNRDIPVEELVEKYATLESDFFPVEGMRVHYRKTGTGPPLLLIHGVASSLHTWSEWHDILSTEYTVISLDIPGFGLTGPHPQDDYTTGMYGRVFNRLLDHLGLDRVFMAGNSLGGLLTWNYALQFPERLCGIALLNSAGLNTHWEDLSDIGFMLALHPYSRGMTHVLTPRSLVRASLRNAVFDPIHVTGEKVTRYHELLLREGNRESFSKILDKLVITGEDNLARLAKISVPTLILWGVHDNLITVGYAYQFERAISNARLIIYEEAGHLPMEEIPERSAQDLHQFFQSISTPE